MIPIEQLKEWDEIKRQCEVRNLPFDDVKYLVLSDRKVQADFQREEYRNHIAAVLEDFEKEFIDPGNEMYGLVKHNNTVIRRQLDFLSSALFEDPNTSK